VEVRLHARNTDVDDQFREVVNEKIGRAARVFDGLGDVDVELIEERNPRLQQARYRLEVTAAANGRIVRITSDASTPEAALDEAADRFTRRLRRLKERLIDRNRKAAAKMAAAHETPTLEEPEIVRVKQFVMKPMTVEEAALQMELLGHDFFFFRNVGSDEFNVLYRRRDGRLGLIEPA